jgi:hypothetical protein
VNDRLLARLTALLADHYCIIARLTLLDDRGTPLVTRALTDCNASTNRTKADASFFGACSTRSQSKTGRNKIIKAESWLSGTKSLQETFNGKQFL